MPEGPQKPGLRILAHDGKNLRTDKTIDARELRGMRGKNLHQLTVESLPQVEQKFYQSLGKSEITAIDGVSKDDSAGWQGYIAYIKDGKVMEMGLPHVTRGGDEHFLPLENITIGDLAAMIDSLPAGVEIALIWRLDRDMTKDIQIQGNSLVYSLSSVHQPANDVLDFSLLDQKPAVGCGGAMGKDIIVEMAEVKLYCGEDDDPIRLNLMAGIPPPESFSFDCFDAPSFFQPLQPHRNPGPQAERQAMDNCVQVADAHWQNGRIHTMDDHSANLYVKITLVKPRQNLLSSCMDGKPESAPLQTCGSPVLKTVSEAIRENPIISLLMNPSERRLWGKLYGLPEEAEAGDSSLKGQAAGSVIQGTARLPEMRTGGTTCFAMKVPAAKSASSRTSEPFFSAKLRPMGAPATIPEVQELPAPQKPLAMKAPRLFFILAKQPRIMQRAEPVKAAKQGEKPPASLKPEPSVKKKKSASKRKALPKLKAEKKAAPKRMMGPQADLPRKKGKPRRKATAPPSIVGVSKLEAGPNAKVRRKETARRGTAAEAAKATGKKKKAAAARRTKTERKKGKKKMNPYYMNGMLGLHPKKKKTKGRRTRARSSG
ncbi:MAG: hypothetical protein ABII71_00815 [Candidatus Micrarchaeota archaeon]